MNFFNILAKRRWYVVALLASLLWFQVFLMFSAHEELNAGVLRSGGVSVLKALGRTGSELLPTVRGDRSRLFLLILLLLIKAVRPGHEDMRAGPGPAFLRAYGIWELLIGKELASLPHSDMVLRN